MAYALCACALLLAVAADSAHGDEPATRARTSAHVASLAAPSSPVRPAADDRHRPTDEQVLLYRLMAQYEKAVRPVRNASAPIVVKLGLTLTNIFDMDEKNQVLTINVWLDQEWNDELLRWDPAEFNGLDNIRVPCDLLWLPDIVLYNNADDYTTGYMRSRAMVYADGTVFWPPPTQLRSTCKIDVTYFPFDSQRCHLKFGSWTYHGFQVDVTNRSANVDLSNYVVSGEFELVTVHQKRRVVRYTCCPEPYPDVTFFIHVRRKTLYYMYNVVFPCMMMSALTLLVFCLPPDSGEKIALGITVLLAFSVFVLAIAEKMPETSDSMPLIGIYLTIVMGMTSVSVVMTVMVLNFHHRGPNNKEMPPWIRWLVLDKLRRALCIQPPPATAAAGATQAAQAQRGRGSTGDSDALLRRLSLKLTIDNLQENLYTNAHGCDERPTAAPGTDTSAARSALAAEVVRTLGALAARQELDDELEAVAAEWRCAAQVVDRLLFWLFLVATVLTTTILLVIVPLARHATDTEELDERLFGINPVD